MENGSITVSRNELASAVAYAATGISKRPHAPVMAGMSVKIWAGFVTFGGFDYQTCTEARVHGTDYEGGSILVNGAGLLAAVKSLPPGKRVTAMLTITTTDGPDNTTIPASLVISCAGIETTVAAIDATDYPGTLAMPEVTGLVDAGLFKASAGRVTPAAGTDDTLPVLTHVCITSDTGKLEMAATDRYRLAVDRVPWTGPDGQTIIFPASVLAGFVKVADATGKITVHVGDTHTGLSDGTHTVITTTIDPAGRPYPKYGQFFRTEHDTVVTADASKLRDAMVRAGKLSGRRDRTGFDVASGSITVSSFREGAATGTQHVTAEVDGPDYLTGFNAGYLASMLAGFTGSVRLGFKTTTRTDTNGAKITTPGPVVLAADDTVFTAVVMVLRPKS